MRNKNIQFIIVDHSDEAGKAINGSNSDVSFGISQQGSENLNQGDISYLFSKSFSKLVKLSFGYSEFYLSEVLSKSQSDLP